MSDKRSVATDALATLGTIIGENEKRDAIHLAVIPAKAGETLRPGQGVNMKDGIAVPAVDSVGIVDPFLSGNVEAGKIFWLILRPRTIQSLRHVWSHPAFPDEPMPAAPEIGVLLKKSESEKWLREFCEKSDCPRYEIVIAAAVGRYVDQDGESYGENEGEDGGLFFSGLDAHSSIPPEFWDHVEVVTGQKITSRPTYFSCSC